MIYYTHTVYFKFAIKLAFKSLPTVGNIFDESTPIYLVAKQFGIK